MIALALGILFLTFFGYFLYGLTGFGHAIIFQIGWYILCVVLSYPGTIAEAVTYMSFYITIMSPLQVWATRKHFNWKLTFWLLLSLSPGIFMGTYLLLFLDSSAWVIRFLGLLFLFVFFFQTYQDFQLACKTPPSLNLTPVTATTSTSDSQLGLQPPHSPIVAATAIDDDDFAAKHLNDESNETTCQHSEHVEGYASVSVENEAIIDMQEAEETQNDNHKHSYAVVTTETSCPAPSSPRPVPFDTSTWKRRGIICFTGLFAGFLGGFFATDGPPLMVFVTHYRSSLGKEEWLATRALLTIIIQPIRMVVMFYSLRNDPILDFYVRWPIYLCLLLGSGGGLAVSRLVVRRINRDVFARIILLLLLSGSCLLITSGIPFIFSTGILIGSLILYALASLFLRRVIQKRRSCVFPEEH